LRVSHHTLVAGKASSAVRDPWRESSLRATSSSEASTAGVPAAIVEWTGRCCWPVPATERERCCSLLLPLSWMHDDLAEASKALFASVKGRKEKKQGPGRERRRCPDSGGPATFADTHTGTAEQSRAELVAFAFLLPRGRWAAPAACSGQPCTHRLDCPCPLSSG